MACKYVVLPRAQEDIEDIVRYLAVDLASPSAAASFLDELESKLVLVCAQPEMHALSRLPRVATLGYRPMPVKRYVALYRYDGDRVVVAHVFHGSQDYAMCV